VWPKHSFILTLFVRRSIMSRKLIYLISFILLVGLAFSNIASAGLVGWWKLDRDVNDSSGGGRNGVLSGTTLPAYIAGMVAGDSSNPYNARFYPDNNAVNLTGNTLQRYIDLNAPGLGTPPSTSALISSLTHCTFTLWVNYQNPGGGDRNQRYFSFGTSGTNEMRLMPRESSSPPTYFAITTPVSGTSTTDRVGYGSNLPGGPGIGNTLPMNRWCHLAVTIGDVNTSAKRTYTLYIDGVQVGRNGWCTLTPNSLNPAPTISWLGRSIATADGQYITSYVDDFRIYDVNLTQDQIREAMGYPIATFPSPGDGTVFSPAMQILAPATVNVTLSWTKGAFAANTNGHHVYVGTNWADVDAVTPPPAADKGLKSTTSYPLAGPNAPPKGVIYYWRIDEVNGATTWRGNIWSFMITPKFAYFPIPSDGATLVPPKMILRWTAGEGAIRHDVYFGTDNPPLTLRQFLTAPRSDPNWSPYRFGLTLAYNTTYYWQIKEWDGATLWAAPVWSFRTVPNPPPEPNLVGWWKFDDNLTDSAYGCDGTAYGGPTYTAGFYERAISINNANNTDPDDDIYVDVPIGNVISSLRASTFAMWVNWLGGGNHQRFFSFGTAPGNHVHFAPHTSGSAPMHFQITTPASSPVVGYGSNGANAGTICPTDGWHHVAATIAEPNATTGRSPLLLYLDGIQVGSNTTATANRTPSNVGVTTRNWFGRSEDPFGQREYNGSLDDVRIYDKALTPAELQVVMFGDPNLSNKPWPVNWSAPDVERVKPLSWTKGRSVDKHDVYFGTGETAVHDANTSIPMGVYRGQQAKDANTYPLSADTLEMNRTYYWRVDEVNGTKVWKGFVWRFTVADYLTVDDFESYNNTTNKIFNTWKAVGNAKVGYTDTIPADYNYAEVMIGLTPNGRLHGGRQAMPFDYNNLTSLFDSNVYVIPSQQNWTRLGVKALSLWTRGNMAPVGSFIKRSGPDPNYAMTASGTDFDVQNWRKPSKQRDEFHYAYAPITGNCDIIAKVNSLTQAGTAQSRAAVMIRDSLADDSAFALVSINSGGVGVTFQYRGTAGGVTTSVTQGSLSPPYWLWLERYYSSIIGDYVYTAWRSPSGLPETWSPIGEVDSIVIPMTHPIYIGLAVTSRNAASSVTGVFSSASISITQGGTVEPDPGNRLAPGGWDGDAQAYLGRGTDVTPSPSWTSHQDIGIKSNTAAPLYVTLQDGSTPPKTKTVIHDDPNITLATTHTEWRIPIARFGDVNMAAIKKITIGVGPGRSVSPHVGVGTEYVDDIALYIPRCITGRPRAAADLTANVNDRDDSDCIVGYADLQALTDRWLLAPQTSNLAIDMDDSNMVDIKDYAILASMWLEQILWPPPVTKVWAYEFKNDANCYTGTVTDANDLHLEFDGTVFLIDTGPFSTFNNADTPADIGTFRGSGTNKITLASGASTPTTSVPAYRKAIIRVGCIGAEKTLTKWWWTGANRQRTSKEMTGVDLWKSCKKID
jgi:hypothetical protein